MRELGIEALILTGIYINFCVQSTAMGTYPGTFRPSLNSTKLCPSETGRERPRALRYVVGPALFKEAIILSMTPQKTGQYMQGIIQASRKSSRKEMEASIGATFFLKDAPAVHEVIMEREFFGKIVLSPIE